MIGSKTNVWEYLSKSIRLINKNKQVHVIIPASLRKEFVSIRHMAYLSHCFNMPLVGNKFILRGYSAYVFLKNVKQHLGEGQLEKSEKFINTLTNSKLTMYSAGAIENAADFGVGTREEIKTVMNFTKSVIISPCDFSYNQDKYPTMKMFQKDHTVEETQRYVEPIVMGDIEAVKDCDITVISLDENCGPGTASEATVARALGKPVYAIKTKNADLNNVHPWILGCVLKIFDTSNDFREFFVNE